MAYRRLLEKLQITDAMRDWRNWPSVDDSELTADRRVEFRRRKRAVTEYLDTDRTMRSIAAQAHTTTKELGRVIKRVFTQKGKDGTQIYGFEALISSKHIAGYTRKTSATVNERGDGGAGLFSQLLARNEGLDEYLWKQAVGKKVDGAVPERKKAFLDIHKAFLKKLRDLGVKDSEYPFNVKNKGLVSMRTFLNEMREERLAEWMRRRELDYDARWVDPLKGKPPRWMPKVFEIAQFDGHANDTQMVVMVPMPEGFMKAVPIQRICLMGVADKASRAITGYQLIIAREYNSEDVVHTLASAIIPWQPLTLSIQGLEYPKGTGLPSGVVTDCAWALWDKLELDNAWANLSRRTLDALGRNVHCMINDGPAKVPELRGILERVFQTIEERTGHRLPSTFGSGPEDTRRTDPEAMAIKYQITVDDLHQLLDVEIARYNATPHSGLYNQSPLTYIRNAIASGVDVRKVFECERAGFDLNELEIWRPVHGNIAEGKRPYIQFEHIIYRNEVLSESASLINTEIKLRVRLSDLRVILAYLPDGTSLGPLTAAGVWGIWPHSYTIRKLLFSSETLRHLTFQDTQDPGDALLQEFARRAKKSKRAATMYAALLGELKKRKTGESGLIMLDKIDDDTPSESAFETRMKQRGEWIEIGKTVVQ